MRAALLGALLCGCASPAVDEPQCELTRCVNAAPGVVASFQHVSLTGALDGEWVELEGGALIAFSHAPTASVEIHAVELDGERVFDVTDAAAGVEPRLGVRPTGSPPTLIAPAGTIEVLLRASAPTELTVVSLSRDAPGRELTVVAHVLDPELDPARVDHAVEEAEAVLGIPMRLEHVEISAGEREAAEASGYQLTRLAGLVTRQLAAAHVFFIPPRETGFVGETSSTPLSPVAGEGAIAINAESAGGAFGQALAHELGHALGLLHVSEEDGFQVEALTDTPTCLEDITGDGRADAADCPEAAANLMFWDTSGGTALSPMQRARMAASPLLR